MHPIAAVLFWLGAYGLASASRAYVRKFDRINFFILMLLALFAEIILVTIILGVVHK